MSLRATWPRLRPLSWRACFTLPVLISTPRRRPRRRLEATFSCRLGLPGSDACRDASDMAVRLTEFTSHLTRLDRANFAQQQMCPLSAPTEIAVASSVKVANMAAKSSLRIENSPPLPSGPGSKVPKESPAYSIDAAAVQGAVRCIQRPARPQAVTPNFTPPATAATVAMPAFNGPAMSPKTNRAGSTARPTATPTTASAAMVRAALTAWADPSWSAIPAGSHWPKSAGIAVLHLAVLHTHADLGQREPAGMADQEGSAR